MNKTIEQFCYGAYYRKSSDDEDRQAYSISDQTADLNAVEKRENLNVKIKFPGESQSAFSLGRPIFADLVKNIMAGAINAILVWHANRLARNPVDAGMIIHLMDIGKLKRIKTPSRTYENTASDKFALYLELIISKKDSDDKSEVVKRALDGRAMRGLPHGLAHIGYINDQSQEKGNRGILEDPIRFPLCVKVLEMALTRRYTVSELCRIAKDELKLTTITRKKEGGRAMSISYMYRFLRDPIHGGFFYRKSHGVEKRYELKGVRRMLSSEDDYWAIQDWLGAKGRPRTIRRTAVYNNFAKCGVCNGNMFPDFKFQVICSGCKKKFSSLHRKKCPACDLAIAKMTNPKFLNYVFYYCINNKKHRTICPGNGIEEKDLEHQLLADMEQNLAISKDLATWCIDNIGKLEDKAIDDSINLRRNLEQEKTAVESRLRRLTMLRISSDHDAAENAEFDRIQKELRNELSMLELKLSDSDVDWLNEAIKDFDLMSEVLQIIQSGTAEQKKDILHAFGSNLTITEKKVTVTNKKSIEVFKTYLRQSREENRAFEPAKFVLNKAKNGACDPASTSVLRR